MRNEDIIRAWKDEAFRKNLDADLPVPAHPAGMLELDDEALEAAAGGDIVASIILTSIIVSVTIEIGREAGEAVSEYLDCF